MTKQEFTSKLTGEVLPFQTKYSYKNDKSEDYKDIPSDTDATLFVPLKTMISKIVRGDISELLRASLDVEMDDSDAFEVPSDAPGYDLADAFDDSSRIIDESNHQSSKETKAEETPAPESKDSEATETKSNAAE